MRLFLVIATLTAATAQQWASVLDAATTLVRNCYRGAVFEADAQLVTGGN